MVSPLQAWIVVLVATMVTALIWIVSAPIVSAMYAGVGGQLSEEAQGPANLLRIQFIVFPVVICVGLAVWAFLVTTRRQMVTTPGGYY